MNQRSTEDELENDWESAPEVERWEHEDGDKTGLIDDMPAAAGQQRTQFIAPIMAKQISWTMAFTPFFFW